MDAFEFLLDDLSKEMGTTLKVDQHHTCLIKMKNTLEVSLELDRTQQNLIIGISFPLLPAGKYREQILKEALLSNGELPPKNGIFAYSQRKGALVLFEKLPLLNLDAQKVHQLIKDLYVKALPWHEAMQRNELPQINRQSATAENVNNIFKIKL